MPAWKDWRGWSFIAGHFENLGRFSNHPTPPPPSPFTVLHPSFLEMTPPKILLVVKVNLPPPPPN